MVAWPNGEVAGEVTPVQNDHALRDYEADYLCALLGEPVERDSTIMSDGRVLVLACGIDFDLNCRALTAELIVGKGAVQRRDAAWQTHHEPLDRGTIRPGSFLSSDRRGIAAAIYSRHHDGRVRQLWLPALIGWNDAASAPFLMQLVGEYVVELVADIDAALDRGGPESPLKVRLSGFAADNAGVLGHVASIATPRS